MSAIVLRCSLGDLEVSRLILRLPLRGCWTGTMEIGWAEAPADGEACTLRFARADGSEDVFVGAVLRSRLLAEAERVSVTIEGGAGTMLSPALAARYHSSGSTQIKAGLVLAGIAADAGQTLAAGAEAELNAYPMPSWQRMQGTARAGFDTLAGMLSLGWRVLASGEVWMGAETWATVDAATLDRGYFETGDPADGMVLYATDATPFFPGTTINGARAVEVCYQYDAMLEDRSRGALRAEVRTALPGDPVYAPDLTLYRCQWAGTVQEESTDGALAIKCDDARMGDGLRGVPARTSWPGCSMTVPEGTRVRVAFEGGDPRLCFAASSIDQDTAATLPFALMDDESDCGVLSGTVSIAAFDTPTPILLTYAGPFSNASAASSATLTGKIVGPCHAYAKGKPA